MPHIEIKYSEHLDFDPYQVFDEVERIINQHDANARECKSRAYPCGIYKHPHILINISLLAQPHRDYAWTQMLSQEIEQTIKSMLKQSVYFSLGLEYSGSYYTTNNHLVAGDPLPVYQP